MGNRDRTFLVLAPMPIELRAVVKAMRLRPGGEGTQRGVLGGASVVAAVGGIGPAKAERETRRRIAEVHPTHVLVVGVAGGVRRGLAIGELVVPATVHMVHDHDPSTLGPPIAAHRLGGTSLAGTLITTRDLITDPAVHDAHRAAGVDAVDMETAAVAAVCEEAGLPWTAFRGISDHVDEGLLADPELLDILGPDGAPRPAAAARLVVRRPRIVRSFVRLGRGSSRATRAAATAAARAIEATPPS